MVFEHFEQTTTFMFNPVRRRLQPDAWAIGLCFFLALGGLSANTSPSATLFGPESLLTVDAGADQSMCAGDTVQLEATGAAAYQWSPSSGLSCTNCADPLAFPDTTTLYIVTGSDGSIDSLLVTVYDPPTVDDVAFSHPTDCNIPDGTIVFTATGNGPYEYSVDGGTAWQTVGIFTALPPGLYSLMVRTPGGECAASGGTLSLVAPTSPEILNVLQTNPTLCDTPNGAIVIAGGGGIQPLQFSIDGGVSWQNQNTFQLLGAGNYELAVRNADGSCEISGGTVTLTGSPQEAFITDIFEAHPTNCGVSDGIITVVVANDDGSFEYSINGGIIYQPLNSFANLPEGTYHVVVRRNNGTCVTNGGFVQLVSPNRPTVAGYSAVSPLGCGAGNGNITVIAFGASTLEFSINGGASWQASNVFQGLGEGAYQIVVRNADGTCSTNGEQVVLTEPDPPVITGVSFTSPSGCGLSNGSISVAANGQAALEYSINNGTTWSNNGNFTALAEGQYQVVVRYQGGGCQVAYGLNPLTLASTGSAPVINQVLTTPPTCGTATGSINVQATGGGVLNYSINGGTSFQGSSLFNNLAAGSYAVVVSQVGGNCTAASLVALNAVDCTDTIQVSIPAGVSTIYCIDPSTFEIAGLMSGAGICGMGNAASVAVTAINLDCVTLQPAAGFTGQSPDLICTVHCFNNNNSLCDTTYLQVTVQGQVLCDEAFGMDSVTVNFIANPTNYCVPVPFSVILGYDLSLNGTPIATQPCNYVATTAYSYAFLPGGGFSGPYTLDGWSVNGVNLTGAFLDAYELVDLMNFLDPAGAWTLNMQGSLIYGGGPANTYGNMEVTHNPSGTSTVLMTNFTQLPAGILVPLPTPGGYELTVFNPDNGCADTLFINAGSVVLNPETVVLTTSVNTPTAVFCLDASELPGGDIINVGYCASPTNGVAPIVNDTCLYYQPNLNFAGQDAFCMIVCDAGFPQACDTTYFVVNVLPETDTIFLNIPPAATSVDTCLSGFVIELPGPITSAGFCGINLNQVTGSAVGNCLIFNEVAGFSGETEVCVVQCSGTFCDTTIVVLNIEPPIICETIFAQDTVTITSASNSNVLCIPVPPGEIVNYEVMLDGQVYNSSFTPCDFQNRVIYDYATVPAGSFSLQSWSVNGVAHTGSFANLQALVDSMNVWDPSGNWSLNAISQVIEGGLPGTDYSSLVLVANGQTFTLPISFMLAPFGSQMPISGFGSHLLVLTKANGCTDSVTVVLEQHVVMPEIVLLSTSPNTTLGPVCANTTDLLGNLFSVNFCGLPSNGSVSLNNDTCLVYTPNLDFLGTDTICLVLCDDSPVNICDTFIYVITVNPAIDTLYLTATSTAPFDTCLTTNVLQLPGNIVSGTVCGADPSEVAISMNGVCASVDLADGFTGTTVACVINCNDAVPAICDTTILVISFDSVPPVCPELFNPDEVIVTLSSGSAELCLPVPVTQIGNYDLLLDGSFYNNALMPCNFDSVYIYFYGLVFGQGGQGPYNFSWVANGSTFTGTVANMDQLVVLMNNNDPAGDWVLEPTFFTLLSSNDQGVYGNLTITHVASGMVSNLAPDFNGLPQGTGIIISGAGQHEVVLVNNADGCPDTLLVNAINMADMLDITTLENTISDTFCLDTTGLPGSFDEMTICQAPQNGTVQVIGNCFIFTPDTGFVGNDQACLTVCDGLGNCDTTLVDITVLPLCAQFDFFPEDQQTLQVISCSDIAAYCVPVTLDSIGSFGVLDNGAVYAGGFSPCNGTLAQIVLDTGFHEIVFFHLGTGCTDTLLALVTCTVDSTGCGISALSPTSLVADDCAATVQFCVDVPLTDLPNFVITDNGGSLANGVVPCDSNALSIAFPLDTGFHELVLEDTVKGCVDTFLVNVSCFLLEDSVVNVTVPMGDTLVICLGDFGYPLADIDTVILVCDSTDAASISIDPLTWCFSIAGDSMGLDSACLQIVVGDSTAIFTVNIGVTMPCPVYFPTGYLATSVACDADTAQVCLPISLVEMQGKVLEINGLPYLQPVVPCDFEGKFVLNYGQLPSAGQVGPYIVEEWTVNGTVFTGVFNSAQELADSMNIWDPSGSWQVIMDPVTSTAIIVGGTQGNVYGGMRVEQQITGLETTLVATFSAVPLGVAIELPVGTYLFTVTDTITNCTESATIEVTCVTSEIVVDTLQLGESDTFCLDLTELLGSVESVENICPGSQGEIVGFEFENNCVIYQANELGLDSACVVICDSLGVCDTTYFFITVEFSGDSLPVAVNDTIVTGQGFATTIEVLQNDTVVALIDFDILVPPAHGSAVFLPNGTINYVPDADFCSQDIQDTLVYEICNPVGCDTATVYITVLCSELEVFDAFSPNGDDKNEFFKINGLQDYPNNHLQVFNRWGNLVYEGSNYQNDWDGTWNGQKLPDGTYFYLLELGEGDSPLTGYVVILR